MGAHFLVEWYSPPVVNLIILPKYNNANLPLITQT